MITSTTISKIVTALLKAQRQMGAATKGSANPYFKSKYADLGAVMEVCKDPLNDAGIFLAQPASSDQNGTYVETTLYHESGEFISTGPMKLELSKTDMQALGSAITYARRYQLQSLLSIPAEDDDAENAVGRKSASPVKSAPTMISVVETPKPTEAESADKPKYGFGRKVGGTKVDTTTPVKPTASGDLDL